VLTRPRSLSGCAADLVLTDSDHHSKLVEYDRITGFFSADKRKGFRECGGRRLIRVNAMGGVALCLVPKWKMGRLTYCYTMPYVCTSSSAGGATPPLLLSRSINSSTVDQASARGSAITGQRLPLNVGL